MKNYLKLRTFIVIAIIAVFAAAMHPLSPRDFYQTFRETLKINQEQRAEQLIESARVERRKNPQIADASAMLNVADREGVNLKEVLNLPEAFDNSDCIGMIRKRAAGSIRLGLDLNGGVEFVLDLEPDYAAMAADGVSRDEAEKRLSQNFKQYRALAIDALGKRLESRNIFETEITPFGERGLSLKAPLNSRDEKDKLQKLIQLSNKLEFRLVHPESATILAASSRVVPNGYSVMKEVGKTKDAPQVAYVVADRPEMYGNSVEQAFVSRGELGQLAIALRFNTAGAQRFAAVTGANVGRQLAIVLDGRLYCAPVINGAITGGQAEITGQFSLEESQNIADALTSGSFPFRIGIAAVYDTDPTLGSDNVRNGIVSGLVALVLLAFFMVLYYRTAGFIAVLALSVNVVLILGAMAAFGATLTMPGIAGIILTLGMAVDANVLVFERMREETERGKSPSSVVELGFQKAYSSVLDGNLTTLIVAVILMYFGSGAVKGFAVSLAIGILASLFTALFMTHVIFDWLLRFVPQKEYGMMKFFSRPNINFIKQAKIAMPLSLAAMILSVAICYYRGGDLLAVDFSGGTLVSCKYDAQVPVDDLEKTLSEAGYRGKVTYKSSASAKDNRKLEILLRNDGSSSGVEAEKLLQLIGEKHPQLQPSQPSFNKVGGQVGSETAKNAVYAVLLAFLGMILYVTVRYELIFAAAGIFALFHDVLISLGVFALMGRELSLPVAAGLLTIIGYSINDTIVIFDRIREERRLFPGMKFSDTVNLSLNATLSRTILTSLTTFIVVFVMFVSGGIAINDFMLVIMLGIVIGSYSSLYIASPIVVGYYKWCDRRAAARSAAAKEAAHALHKN